MREHSVNNNLFTSSKNVFPGAFTLIELLIAIAIIGLLLAIFTPALGKVREQARRAQCANNLRQICMAHYMYMDDHDGGLAPVLPNFWGYDEIWVEDTANGFGFLYPSYVDDLNIFYCPSAKPSFKISMTNFGKPGEIARSDYHYGKTFLTNPPPDLTTTTNRIFLMDFSENAYSENFAKGCNHPGGLNVVLPDGSVHWFNRIPSMQSQTMAEAGVEQDSIEDTLH